MSKRVGRNDLCPCGSGKKYKQCCLQKELHEHIPRPVSSGSLFRESRPGLDSDPLERARRFAAACGPFHGLTPDQLYRLLFGPLTPPELVCFPDPIGTKPGGRIMTLFGFLVERLGEKGVKATATGNLPRQLCRDAARMFWGDFLYEQRTQLKGIYQEPDFFDLHIAHILADIAGLIRKYRGRLILSRECRRRLAESGMAGVYAPMLQAAAVEYNWAYRDYADDLPLVQQACFFSLYLLSRYGDRPLLNVFYEDCFLRVLPMELHGEVRDGFHGPEEAVRIAYTWRTFQEFAEPFGLVELKPYFADDSKRPQFEIRKTPLLDEVVRFSWEG